MSWLPVIVTAGPTSEPVTLAEAKTHCRVDGSDSDAELTAMVVAAREFVEAYCGIKLVTQTVAASCSSWDDLARLPTGPVSAVTGVTYLDVAGVTQTLSTGVYELAGQSVRLKLGQSFPDIRPANNAITVTMTVGGTVPTPIIHAIKLLIGSWFDSRAIGEVGEGVHALLSNYRRF